MPPEETTTQQTTTQQTTTDTPKLPDLPQNWHSLLPDDLKGEKSLELIRDLPSLAKSYVHAQKNFGADKIAIPDKFATEEDWQKVYQRLGLPKDLKEYSIEPSKEMGFEGQDLEDLKAAAHKMGIMPKQLQGVLNWYEGYAKKAIQSTEAELANETKVQTEELKKEWGQAYDKKVAEAQFVIKTLKDDNLAKFLEDTGMGNHPQMIKVFQKLGEMMGEAKISGQKESVSSFGSVKSPAEAKIAYGKIISDSQHPYNQAKHPNHDAAVIEVQELFKQAFSS